MRNLIKVDTDFKEYIPKYLERRHQDIILIKSHIDAGNIEEIRRIGHNMKGNAASYGFVHMGVIGAEIETAAKAKDISLIQNSILELDEYLSSIDIEYID